MTAIAAAANRGAAQCCAQRLRLRVLPDIRYGTERYPEKVARRLRAVNIAVWCVAALLLVFAIIRFLDPTPGRWPIALVNVAASLIYAALPLLHRYGSMAVALAFIGISYAFLFGVSWMVGTGSGVYLYYLTSAALGVLFLGTERPLITTGLAALGALLFIAVHVVAPHNAGFLPDSQLFYTSFVTNVLASAAIVFAVVHYTVRALARAEAVAEREYQRSESLLANILPPRVAARLKDRSTAEIADAYPEASVLFADMAGFTARAGDTAPADLVRFLNGVFTRLDALVERHKLEKIKTTGDAYMVVSGVPEPRTDHAQALATLALDMQDALAGLVDPKGRAVPIRIGMASGPIVAGVVGTRKLYYDVWGDAVNMAARMEQTGEPGKIQVDSQTWERLKDRFVLEPRGTIEVHGKGPTPTWFLVASAEPERTG